MWSIVTVRLPDGHVHGVQLRGSKAEAIAEVVQEARDNGAVKTTGEADDLRKRLEDFGFYTDGDVRIEIVQPKG